MENLDARRRNSQWRWAFILLFPVVADLANASWTEKKEEANSPVSHSLSFFLKIPEDGLALTHGKMDHGLKPFPGGIKSLADTPIANTLALVSRVRDREGNLVGLASELEYFEQKPKSDGLQVWDTYWTLMIAGRGTLYLYEKESLGPEVADIFFSTKSKNSPWIGSLTWASNVGPHPSGHGVIVGGTGDFLGKVGTYEEIGTLLKFTSDGEITADIEIRLHFDMQDRMPETAPDQ